MSRFLRSALFPLIVISMLVYLAIQTIAKQGHGPRRPLSTDKEAC